MIKAGLTPAGAAGMMGNLYAESGLITGRVEVLCLKRLKEHGMNYNDTTYTTAVPWSAGHSNFVRTTSDAVFIDAVDDNVLQTLL